MEADKKNQTDLIDKNIDTVSFFEDDKDFNFLYKKTEKLASAIFIVTNLFSNSESLKWTLREKSYNLLSFMLNYKDISPANKSDFVHNVKIKVLEISSFLEVSLLAGLISQMNFSILKQEFVNFVYTLEKSFIPKEISRDTISRTFFDIPTENDKIMFHDRNHLPSKFSNILSNKMSYGDIKDNSLTSNKESLKRSNRQNVILSLLKKKKELTIKDIAEVIKDCSEKTIQRELVSFINAGILKRTGERRWSKYSLKEQ